ncbi:MAG: MoaD/ThiS family protein [Saprospiraceae bacterium]|nr:MoaD/ThiS family protein [Candidatus Defluviibacterium haderslevense]
MKINILAFGQIVDIIGTSSWTISGVDNTDQLELKLTHDFPGLLYTKYAMAVNKKVIHQNTTLSHDDTVAILPPFSGG